MILTTSDNLDYIGRDGFGVGLEGCVFENEGPDVVTEAECMQMALDRDFGLDFGGKNLGDGLCQSIGGLA
jgi:hypothetical protein